LSASLFRLAITSNGSLKKIAPQPMRQEGLVVLPLNPTGLRFLKEEAGSAEFLLDSLRMFAMHDLDHVLNDKADRGDVSGDFFRHSSSPVVCDSVTVENRSGRRSPPSTPAAASMCGSAQ